jgi:hypothetical protein
MKIIFFLSFIINLYTIPITHMIALNSIEFATPKESVPFTGFFRMKKQSDFFFKDLGAKFIEEKEAGFNGIYLSFDAVRINSGKTFGKWREVLKKPKNTKLLSLFEANLASSNLSELFSFPRDVHFLKNAKSKTVLIFLDYTIPLTMQIREILNFSLRGYNVLAVDFYHYHKGKSFISWDDCKKVADLAYKYSKGTVIVYGKSFGSAPATYLASIHENTPLIIDRPFTCMKEVVGSFFLENFINLHYSYPTEKLIHGVKAAPLIISSSESGIFKDHAEKLLKAYISFQKKEDVDKIKDKCFISTRGGHYSSLLNKGVSSWFSYEQAQQKLNKYLSTCEGN